MEEALRKLPSGERDLVASLLDGSGVASDAELEIARQRLRNIDAKYTERLKRERLAIRDGDRTGEASELEARLDLIRAARNALDRRFQDPGASDPAD